MTQVAWPTHADDSGTLQDGTVIDSTFIETFQTDLNALIHSTANPTITPKTITDEVVTARGTLANLGARLNVEHNTDGTHNLGATIVTTAVMNENRSGENKVTNPKFDTWTNGAASAPDNWTLSGAGAAVARTGVGESDTSRKIGKFAAKITYGSATAILQNTVIAAADWDYFDFLEGDKVSLTVWIYSTVVNKARAFIDDGSGVIEYTAYHTGGGTWEQLTLSHVLVGASLSLKVGFQIEGAGNCIGSGMMLLLSDNAATRFDAPVKTDNQQYLVLAADTALINERVFTPGVKLVATDGGAGAAYTLESQNSPSAVIKSTDLDNFYILGPTGIWWIDGVRAFQGTGTGTINSIADEASHPGIAEIGTGAVNGDDVFALFASCVASDFQECEFIVRPKTAVTNVNYRLGMIDLTTYSDFTAIDTPKGAYFAYNGSGNWQAVAKGSASNGGASTGVAPVAGTWVRLKIKRNGANREFYVNGTLTNTVSIGTQVLNDGTACWIIIGVDMITGSATRVLAVDYMSHTTINPLGARNP